METALAIANLTAWLRNYGYHVDAEPIPGSETAFLESLRAGMRKVDETVTFLHATAHCRGRSKRTLELLHRALPEPAWGVRV